MNLSISKQQSTTAAGKVAVAADQLGITAEQLQALVKELNGGGLLPSTDKTVKSALLAAAALLSGSSTPKNSPETPAQTETKPSKQDPLAALQAQTAAAQSSSTNLEQTHTARIDSVTKGFDAIANGAEVTTLARFVAATFNAKEKALPKGEAQALVLFSYVPKETSVPTWTSSDVKTWVKDGELNIDRASSSEGKRTVVLTPHGLREVGGKKYSDSNKTRPVDAKAMASAGVSLDVVNDRLQALVKDTAAGKALPFGVHMSPGDRLHTEGTSSKLDVAQIMKGLETALSQPVNARGPAVRQAFKDMAANASPGELVDVGAKMLKRVSDTARFQGYAWSGDRTLWVPSRQLMELAHDVLLEVRKHRGSFESGDLTPLTEALDVLKRGPLTGTVSYTAYEPDGSKVQGFHGDYELWGALANLGIPHQGPGWSAAHALGWDKP